MDTRKIRELVISILLVREAMCAGIKLFVGDQIVNQYISKTISLLFYMVKNWIIGPTNLHHIILCNLFHKYHVG